MGRCRRQSRCGVSTTFHRRRCWTASKYSDEPCRCAGGLRALTRTRNRVRCRADDKHDPASLRLQTVRMCLVHVHDYASDGRNCAIQAQPYPANTFVVHLDLLLLCLRQGVGQIKNQPVRMCCHSHPRIATDGRAQRDFHPQVAGCIAHNFQTLHGHCARSRVLCGSTRYKQQQKSALSSCPHFSCFTVLSDSVSIRPTRLSRCGGIGSNSGCYTHSRLRHGGSSQSVSCHGNWCMKRPSNLRNSYGMRSKLLLHCRGWLGTRCG